MEPNPDFWSGQRVCVTGGTGFLGYHLVRQLLDLGADVRVLALAPSAAHPLWNEPRVQKTFGDLRDAKLVHRALSECGCIFHTAGVVAVWGEALRHMHAVHVEGTRNVLAAVPRGARVVHTSSIVAIGASRDPETLTEESAFNLSGCRVDYVHAKRAAEELALTAAARGQHVVVANPGYLLGPEDHERSVMGRFCQRFWRGRLPIAPPGGFNLVDVRDVARGHVLAVEHGQPGRRYILGGENHTLREFLDLLAQAGGLKPRFIPTPPAWLLSAAAGLAEFRAWRSGKEPYPSFQHARLNRYYWYYRSDRAGDEIGYRSRPLRECLADTYRWYSSQGLAPLRGLARWWMRPHESAQAAA